MHSCGLYLLVAGDPGPAAGGNGHRRLKELLASRKALALAPCLVLCAVAATWLAIEIHRWPDVTSLSRVNPPTTAFIDAYAARAAKDGGPPPDWRWVSYAAISLPLKRAVVVAEDIGFFSHRGFAADEIRAALRDRWQEGKKLRGASTLTQQLAKNLWLSPSRSPWRKLKEAILVVQLERHLTKRRILELYLNVVEFGPGIYGAEAAARRYFGVAASQLDDRQAAALAAALPRPRTWHPGRSTPGYLNHLERIHRRMARATWLDRLL